MKQLVLNTATAESMFDQMQRTEMDEKKMLATQFTVNYLKVNRWDKSAPDYAAIYQTAWVEKMMFVESVYNISQILELTKSIKNSTDKILVDVGLIVDRTGAILENQEVIIKQNGEILLIVKENLEVSYEVLGNVKDIKASVEDMQNNGVKVVQDNYQGGRANYMTYLIVGGLILIALIYIKKRFGKGKTGKK